MKTYAESVGEKPFNWLEWLDASIAKLPSSGDLEEKSELANGWPTCACGNLCDVLLRDHNGAPRDVKLRELGVVFVDLIESAYTQRDFSDWDVENDLKAARTTFLEIEARAAELLATLAPLRGSGGGGKG